ncbi:MAG: M13 family metallopeptidase [Bacteroidetes bacterium]|nr:M13 family metallopeptidase [Bacteroidota bacterium]
MKSAISIISFVLILCLYCACTQTKPDEAKAIKLFKPEDFDTTVAPGDNFFMHVNGSWIKNTPIPGTEARWGTFNEVDELRYAILKKLLDEAAADKNATANSNRQKVGDFYTTGMDSVKLNEQALKGLTSYLDQINQIDSKAKLLSYLAASTTLGLNPVLGIYADQDAGNSSKMLLNLSQSGLGLPDRDYYFRNDTASLRIQNEYKKYIISNFLALGMDSAKTSVQANLVYELEKSLAEKSMDRVALRDPYNTYHKMTISELSKLTPDINWTEYFTLSGIPAQDTVNVGMPDYMKRLNEKIKTHPLGVWKLYLTQHLLDELNPYFDDASFERTFHFRQRVLFGVKQPKARWKRVLNTIGSGIGEALGAEYVKVAFSEKDKERMKNVITNMRAAFKQRILNLDWMSDSTKQKAIAKLEKISVKVGYPDTWRDYTALTIDKESFAGNVIRSWSFEFTRNMNKLNKPVDRSEWYMNAYTVNAYYNPSNNEIVFPAAILQPPFYHSSFDDAVVYGGIGAVICHELTHGFDDEGSKFDGDGNLKSWWSKEDAARFEEKTNVLKAQYDQYVVLDSLHINGKLTLGENIADLGGVMIALDAYKKTEEFTRNQAIDGYTPEERFFLTWALIWRVKYTDAAMRNQILTNPHSPGEFRCNGILSNCADFYKRYQVKEGQAMYRPEAERAIIW